MEDLNTLLTGWQDYDGIVHYKQDSEQILVRKAFPHFFAYVW